MSAALIEHFELLASSLGGVAKLRELILSLAVRGKLVPQDPKDEPASELLKKIRAEKDRLIKEGKIKRDKALPPITDDDKPYELPEGWEWGRFADLILASDAGWSPSCDSIPRERNKWGVLKVSAVTWGEFRPEENKALPDHLDPRPECEVQAGDFLLSRANTEELVARSVVAWDPPTRLMLSDKLIRLRFSELVNKKLFCVINNSDCSRLHYIAKASGTSSSMKNVSREVILTLPVPVPPAAEQSRIVAKVEELMALCDKLEAEQGHAARVRGHWVEAALDQLAGSGDADEFGRHWQHLAEHFDTLFTTPESIARLDATLLRLAVRGKLVPQDPEDEPASELLKKIRAEKDRLIKEGKIKRDKSLEDISDEEALYSIPVSWAWVRFGNLGTIGSSSRVHQRDWTTSGIPFYRAREIVQLSKNDFIANDLFITEELFTFLSQGGLVPECDDIMITGVGTIGVPYIVKSTDKFYFKDASVLIFKNRYGVNSSYLSWFLKTPDWDAMIHAESMGTTVHTLTIGRATEAPIPLPPLAEQTRIVAKVEELMALTASLKARLAAAQTKQSLLAEALVADALAC